MPRPNYNERTQWSGNCHGRDRALIDYAAIHTQEGPGSAASLANYCCSSAQVSYHDIIDNGPNVVHVVPNPQASWSVGNANNRVVNVCFAGSTVNWSRQQWLDLMGRGIEFAAWLQVKAALEFGFAPVCRSWDQLRNGLLGLTDHQGINEGVLRVKGHTDCGPNFPWDVYSGHVQRYAAELTGQVVVVPPRTTAIEDCRAANAWLGDKVTPDRESTCPDGTGKFAHYAHGSIYWHPVTGPAAYAIPMEIRGKWEAQGWETGPLGYPTKPKLDLLPFDHHDGRHVVGGTVQAFQFGTVYAPSEGPVCIMKGLVKDRYASLSYETGPLGWPTTDELPWGDVRYGGATQRFVWGVITWINQGDSTIALTDVGSVFFPGYQRSPEEVKATPRDGMSGGISHFAGADDASTAGRKMAITGESADHPNDQWYCAMRFNYCDIQDHPSREFWVKPVPGTSDMALKGYLPPRRLEITNPATGKRVVVRPADWGPGAWAKRGGPFYRVIDVSETAMNALGAITDTTVVVDWVDPGTPLGPR